VLHVNMIIPASESLYAKKFSSLLVLIAKFSRHACVSILSFGRAGYSFRLSSYNVGFKTLQYSYAH
jgi:hypothetical protein